MKLHRTLNTFDACTQSVILLSEKMPRACFAVCPEAQLSLDFNMYIYTYITVKRRSFHGETTLCRFPYCILKIKAGFTTLRAIEYLGEYMTFFYLPKCSSVECPLIFSPTVSWFPSSAPEQILLFGSTVDLAKRRVTHELYPVLIA